jgi:hypothetical protein
MKMSDALRHGITLRPESHRDRFCHIEGRGLCSDAWGAICEAVQPAVANFNWNRNDRLKLERSMDALRAIQQHYFARYFQMPARCPLSCQRFIEAGGRIIGSGSNAQLKTYDDYSRERIIGGVTSECDKVTHLAGMVDHAFYAHGWSREQVLEIVEWYEECHNQGTQHFAPSEIVINFEHYQVN